MSYRLLIADDEKLERDALRYIVQAGSLSVGEIWDASNGREAVEIARRLRPDICFLDIKMPGMSGIDAARSIKAAVAGVRIVFLTAFDYFDYAREAIRIGVEDFLIKPASNESVLEVLRRITESLDRIRSDRERSERVEQKLDTVTAAIEAELLEGIGHGFLDPIRLADYLSLREFQSSSLLAVSFALDFTPYPMKIEGESQQTILRKRCLRLVHSELTEAGILPLGAVTAQGIRIICFFKDPAPESAWLDTLFDGTVSHIRREFSIAATVGMSDVATDASKASDLFSRAQAALGGDQNLSRTILPPAELEVNLVRALFAGDLDAAALSADDLFRWLSQKAHSVAELAERLSDLFVVVRHSLTRRFPRLPVESETFASELAGATDFQRLHAIVRGRVADLGRVLDSSSDRLIPSSVRLACEYIDRHFGEDISLETLAGLARQSTFHLSRLFKQHTGTNVVEYINAVRIEHARLLLESGTLTVKEVSAQSGYADAAYFARVFRRLEGTAPSEYRNRTRRPQEAEPLSPQPEDHASAN